MTYIPRFTFTTESLASIYLRKHFGDRTSAAQISELAEMIEDCVGQAVLAEREALEKRAQPVPPNWLLTTAQDLAKGLASRCYPEVTQFEVLGDLAGVIRQVDNMTCGMDRIAQPVPPSTKIDNFLSIIRTSVERGEFTMEEILARLYSDGQPVPALVQLTTDEQKIIHDLVWEDVKLAQPVPPAVVLLARFEEAVGDYWDCAYQEGHLNRPDGDNANAILHEIRSAVHALVALAQK